MGHGSIWRFLCFFAEFTVWNDWRNQAKWKFCLLNFISDFLRNHCKDTLKQLNNKIGLFKSNNKRSWNLQWKAECDFQFDFFPFERFVHLEQEIHNNNAATLHYVEYLAVIWRFWVNTDGSQVIFSPWFSLYALCVHYGLPVSFHCIRRGGITGPSAASSW